MEGLCPARCVRHQMRFAWLNMTGALDWHTNILTHTNIYLTISVARASYLSIFEEENKS